MPDQFTAPSAEALQALKLRIADRYNGLPQRLKQISQFVLDHPNYVALNTVVENASRAGVAPSAMIRFAKSLGYSGFREMQRVFQTPLLSKSASYAERARDLRLGQSKGRSEVYGLLKSFCSASMVAVEHLPDLIVPEDLNKAVGIMSRARQIHLIAHRRSFAVATYLAYALAHAGKPAHLLDGLGGLLAEQCRSVQSGDAIIAISFLPYAPETGAAVETLAGRGASLIALSDSKLSPLAQHAKVLFEIKEAEIRGFRSLSTSMVLAQTLAVGLALKLSRRA
jgi:DNA-binding MurR/RpiR family transcriptional regulator